MMKGGDGASSAARVASVETMKRALVKIKVRNNMQSLLKQVQNGQLEEEEEEEGEEERAAGGGGGGGAAARRGRRWR